MLELKTREKNKTMASVEDTCPEAIGLNLVLLTFLSISLSIKSFITHPADLMISAPKLNKINSFKLGLLLEATISAIRVGHRSSKVPTGLCNLIR